MTGGATCAYCGLPSPTPPADKGPAYCCFGCRFAAAVARERGNAGQIRWNLTRLGLAIFFTMNVMVFTMALWSRDVFAPPAGSETELAAIWHELFRYLCLLLSVPVLLLLAPPLFDDVWAQLAARRITTDLLLLIGVLASFGYSAVSLLTGGNHVYFEVGCMVLVAVTLGRWLEAVGKQKTTDAIESLARLLPEHARIRRGGELVEVPVDDVRPGDVLCVRAGERLAIDGRVISGTAALDEQLLTGESEPRVVEAGDDVRGGTLNLDGDLHLRATTAPHAGTLDRFVKLVRTAALEKGPYQRVADRLAARFLPLVCLLAGATFLAHTARGSFHEGLQAGLAVVLIACPCALAVATPLAIWSAMGAAARRQILFQHGDALTRLAEIRVVAFDKTGTLTSGDARVTQTLVGGDPRELTERTRWLAAGSSHPHARALERHVGTGDSRKLSEVRTIPGRGIEGRTATGDVWRLGRVSWLVAQEQQLSDALRVQVERISQESVSLVGVAWGGRVHGIYLLDESPRPSAAPAVAALQAQGLRVVVLTGDTAARARHTCAALHCEVRAELLPEEKYEVLRMLRDTFGPVAMVGDGLNDAAALAAADVGVAVETAADLTRESADVCLLGNDLTRLPQAIRLARATVRTIRHNLFWAFAYNVVGIALAMTGWLNPIVAAIAMVASSLFVVSHSLRLGAAEHAESETRVSHKPPAANSLEEPLLIGERS